MRFRRKLAQMIAAEAQAVPASAAAE
jgi:hypothetical protein